MPEGRGFGQPQRYCTNCGAEVRPGNAFCVSCGARLSAGYESTTHPSPTVIGGSAPRDRGLPSRKGIRLALYAITALLFVVVSWLLGFHSFLGVLLVGLLVLVSPVMRGVEGTRSGFDQRASESGTNDRSSRDRKRVLRSVLAAAFVLALLEQAFSVSRSTGLVTLLVLLICSLLLAARSWNVRGLQTRFWRRASEATLVEESPSSPSGQQSWLLPAAAVGGVAVVLLIGLAWVWNASGYNGATPTPNYDVIGPSDTSTEYLRSAVASVETNARSDAEMEALCDALAQEFSERYPGYDAILVTVGDEFGPDREILETMAYFTANWAERDYVDLYGKKYSIACYP